MSKKLNDIRAIVLILSIALLGISSADAVWVDWTDNGGTITASSQIDENRSKEKAFDNITSTKWLTNDTPTGWIQFQFPNGKQYEITRYAITSADDAPDRDPSTWVLYGSNDDSNWDIVDIQIYRSWGGLRNHRIEFTCANPNTYSYYRLDISSNNGDPDLTGFSEMELLEETIAAENPSPASMAEGITNIDLLLSWEGPPEISDPEYRVYFDKSFSMVQSADPSVLKSQQSGDSYLVDTLDFLESYYWRVDVVDGATVYEGVIWQFQTQFMEIPQAANVAPVDNAQNVLGIDTLLQWQAWPGATGHNVYLGTDKDAVAFASDVNGSRQVDFKDLAIIADYWQKSAIGTFAERLDLNDSGVIDLGDISLLATDWLVSDESAFIGTFSAGTNSYDPGVLSPDTTYYWRIDELDGQTVYKGDVWEFKMFKADGLTARIYNNTDFTDLKVTRIDSQISFDWGTGSPDPSVDTDTFSIVWEGGIMVPEKGEYTFYTNTNDGIRLYVNDILIIDQWINQGLTEHSAPIKLRPDTVYPIRMEYYENSGDAAAYLSWSGPGIAKQIIPTAYLTSTRTVSQPEDIWVVDLDFLSTAERLLTLCLQGLVSKEKAAIWVDQDGLTALIRAEMQQEGTVFHDDTSIWSLLDTFIDHIDGIIVCGSSLNSINAATSLCGPMNAVAVDQSLLSQVQSQTGLPILADMRGQDAIATYNTYQDLFGHEMVIDTNKVVWLRDIGVTRNAFIFYNVDSPTRIQFIDGLTSQGTVMGWGSNAEYGWIKDVSEANAAGVPSDWSRNLSVLSKLPADIPLPPRKYPAPAQEGERIVAFSMSDGDNLQIMGGDFIYNSNFFGHPSRGTFPMSWEFPPIMADLIPRGVRRYYNSAASTGDNIDCFIAAPSGAGYAFHHFMPDRQAYAETTGQAMEKCRLTVTTMINENPQNTGWPWYIEIGGEMSDADELLDRPEIMGVVYKDWAPYSLRDGEIYWHNGKPCVSYKYLLWGSDVGHPDNLGDWETVSAGIALMPSSPTTNPGSYALVNANAWSFSEVGGPMQAIVNTIDLLPPNTRVVTVEELIILLRNNFGDPISEQEYNAM